MLVVGGGGARLVAPHVQFEFSLFSSSCLAMCMNTRSLPFPCHFATFLLVSVFQGCDWHVKVQLFLQSELLWLS